MQKLQESVKIIDAYHRDRRTLELPPIAGNEKRDYEKILRTILKLGAAVDKGRNRWAAFHIGAAQALCAVYIKRYIHRAS